MRKVENAEDLMIVAARQGVTLSEIEAQALVESYDCGDYGLCRDDSYNLYAYPFDKKKFNGYEDITIHDVCLEAIENVEDMMADMPSEEGCSISDLRKERYILRSVEEKIKNVIPPTVREYQVMIVENLKKIVTVEAASVTEAIDTAKKNYENGDYLMDEQGNFAGTYFSVVSC